MVLTVLENEKREIESKNINNLFVFQYNNMVLVFSKNEKFIRTCKEINEFLIKIKDSYYIYISDGEDIDLNNEAYDGFFLLDSIIDDIQLLQLLLLKKGIYWTIYNTLTKSFISKQKFIIENKQFDLYKESKNLYKIPMKDEHGKGVILDLLSRSIAEKNVEV